MALFDSSETRGSEGSRDSLSPLGWIPTGKMKQNATSSPWVASHNEAAQVALDHLPAAHGRERLNVLVLDEEVPHPPNAGKRIRTWNILSRLAKRHSVTLLCYGVEGGPGTAALEDVGIRVRIVEPQPVLRGVGLYSRLLWNLFSPEPFSVTKHYSARFHDAVRDTLEESNYDLVHCEWTPYARYVEQLRTLPVVIGAHNIESDIWQRRSQVASNIVAKAFFWTQERKMRRFERKSLLQAAAVTAVTEKDSEIMMGWGVKSASVAPNGVDLTMPVPSREVERDDEILFLASLDWHPNVDSLEYFVTAIFPIVLAQNPRAQLRIVGRKPAPSLAERYSNMPGVDFVGEADDLHPLIARAGLLVVPLRIGGGSRLKILEALALEKAVVSTSIGAEGLDVVSGEHLLIADEPEEFAQRILQLQGSKSLRCMLGRNGRRIVTQLYGWDGIASRVEAAWFSAMRQHKKGGEPHSFPRPRS